MSDRASAPACQPLAGVKVLDLSRLLPGPLATRHLADLGADVVKIEDMGAGDYAGPTVRAIVNRNKRAIRIDLKQAGGRAALLRLAASADVLVEGFRPGVMDRLGLGVDTLLGVNPRLVCCSVSGYGQRGPLRDLAGHDINYLALTGVADQIGTAQGPALSNVPVADLLGGTMPAVMGILAALFDAARTGRGRHVDVAIADAVMVNAIFPLATIHRQGRTSRIGDDVMTGATACYGYYATSDGRHVAVGALEPKFWQAACAVLGRPDLVAMHRTGDPETEAWLRSELTSIFARRSLAHWAEAFRGTQCCVTPVLYLEEALNEPNTAARGLAVADLDDGGSVHFRCPVRFGDMAPPEPLPAPRAGQHTSEILRQHGYGDAEIDALRACGAVG